MMFSLISYYNTFNCYYYMRSSPAYSRKKTVIIITYMHAP